MQSFSPSEERDRSWVAPDAPADVPSRRQTSLEPAERVLSSAALAGSPVARLQPRTVGQLLDAGFEVLRFRFRTIAVVAATLVLPLYVLPQILSAWAGSVIGASDTSSAPVSGPTMFTPFLDATSGAGGDALLTLLSTLGLFVAQMLMGVAAAHLVTSWLMGRDPSAGETLRFVARRTPVAIGALFLATLIKATSIVTCGLALAYLVPLFAVLAPVVAAEPVSAADAIRRTVKLSRPRIGPIMGICLLWWVVSSLLTGGAGLLGALITQWFDADSDIGTYIGQGVAVATTVTMLVVQVAVTALVYVDLRVRGEGLDLELEMMERFVAPAH